MKKFLQQLLHLKQQSSLFESNEVKGGGLGKFVSLLSIIKSVVVIFTLLISFSFVSEDLYFFILFFFHLKF